MKTFLLDIIPKIQKFSQKLDNNAVLTNKHWVIIDENNNDKIVFIFREKNGQLLISNNGKIEKGTWEYLGNNSLLIDRDHGSFLFKQGFIDDTVMALKVDGKNEYALLVNENKFDSNLNSLNSIIEFLNNNYGKERVKNKFSKSKTVNHQSTKKKKIVISEPQKNFSSADYPELQSDIDQIRNEISKTESEFAFEILISFCKNHSLKTEYLKANPNFANKVISQKLPIKGIEKIYKENKENTKFIFDFEQYINSNLNKNYR